jgi:hypothetical protein
MLIERVMTDEWSWNLNHLVAFDPQLIWNTIVAESDVA